MKNHKQFIAGFVTCFILLSFIFIPGYAEDALQVMLNPYPIVVNGQILQVESYNINGFTFLKLADIGTAFNATTKFNETKQQIELTTNSKTVNTSNNKQPTIINYDLDSKKPINAELIDYKGCRALKYENKTFVHIEDLYILGLVSKIIDTQERTIVYEKNGKTIIFDRKIPENIIIYLNNFYYNIEVFEELIGD